LSVTETFLKSIEDLLKSPSELETTAAERILKPLRDREAFLKSPEDLLKSDLELIKADCTIPVLYRTCSRPIPFRINNYAVI